MYDSLGAKGRYWRFQDPPIDELSGSEAHQGQPEDNKFHDSTRYVSAAKHTTNWRVEAVARLIYTGASVGQCHCRARYVTRAQRILNSVTISRVKVQTIGKQPKVRGTGAGNFYVNFLRALRSGALRDGSWGTQTTEKLRTSSDT